MNRFLFCASRLQPIHTGCEGVFSFMPEFHPTKLRVYPGRGIDLSKVFLENVLVEGVEQLVLPAGSKIPSLMFSPEAITPDLILQKGRRIVVKLFNEGPGGFLSICLSTYQWGDPIGEIVKLLKE